MIATTNYLGAYPLGAELEIDGIKIMQLEWKALYRPTILSFGKAIQGANPMFSRVFVAVEDGKAVFFAANECGIGKYHIWSFSDKVIKKLREHKKLRIEK